MTNGHGLSKTSGDGEDELEVILKSLAKAKGKVIVDPFCINARCGVQNAPGMTTASGFECHFYGVKINDKKKRKICRLCKL